MQPYTGILLAFLLPCAVAQTITTTDALGETVLEVSTLDVDGIPTAVIIQTIPAAAPAATVTTTTTDQRGQTVVEAIGPDGAGGTQTQTIQTITPPAAQGVTTTVTTIDGNGATVVEVVNGDGQGDSTTQTIQTIPTTQAAGGGGPGPVGQPGPTVGGAGAPTPFTYTTTNANGETTAVVATFIPSVATAVPVSQTFKATVLDYSQYVASYVKQTPTQNTDANNAATGRSVGWWGPCLSVVASVLSGVVVVWGA